MSIIEINGVRFHSCNGICDPERSTQVTDIYKMVKEFSKKEYITSYDIERYMLSIILNT